MAMHERPSPHGRNSILNEGKVRIPGRPGLPVPCRPLKRGGIGMDELRPPPSARIEAVQSAGYLVLSNALSSRSRVPELKSGHTSILQPPDNTTNPVDGKATCCACASSNVQITNRMSLDLAKRRD
jgi:hypothetical protein